MSDHNPDGNPGGHGGDDPDSEPIVALPGGVSGTSPRRRWGSIETDRREGSIQRQQVYRRTERAIKQTIERRNRAIIDAIMGSGKTTGFANAAGAAAREDIKTSYLAPRRELMREMLHRCEQRDLCAKILPSFTRDCPSANPGHPLWREVEEDLSATVHEEIMDLYARGLSPKELHKCEKRWLGQPLPCSTLDTTCPYSAEWGDEDDQDVLIGHYVHSHVPSVVEDRGVVFDEFPEDAFLVDPSTPTLGTQSVVSRYLNATDGLPFDTYTELLAGRDTSAGEGAKEWFEEDRSRLKPGPEGAATGHVAAPTAVYTLLTGRRLDNGWESARLPAWGRAKWYGVHNPTNGEVKLLIPPPLWQARAVVCLDGTPTKPLWETALGQRLRIESVLNAEEKQEFVRGCLGLEVVITTDALKPYSSGKYVDTDQDAALLETVGRVEERRPDLITSKKALSQYDEAGLLSLAGSCENYGNLISSNQFAKSRLGCVVGSRHYGDDYIKRWGALAGKSVKPNNEHGHARSYGTFGNKVLTHMREHQTLQAVMRFGRDGGGARIYVHTDTLPDWFPVKARGRAVKAWSAGMKSVIKALTELGDCTARQIAEHTAVNIGLRQVQNNVRELERRGLIQKSSEKQGNAFVYRDGNLHRSWHGVAELGLEDDAKRAAKLFEPGERVEENELTAEQAHNIWHSVPYASEYIV